MSNTKAVVMLLGLVACLALYAFTPKSTSIKKPIAPTAQESKKSEPTSEELAPEEFDALPGVTRQTPFSELVPEVVSRFKIVAAQSELELARSAQGPLAFSNGKKLNRETLAGVLASIAQISLAEPVGRVSEGKALDDFGLNAPSLSVTIETDREDLPPEPEANESSVPAAKQSFLLLFGNEHPVTKRRYFTFGAMNEIYSLDPFHYDSIVGNIEKLEDATLLSFSPRNTAQLSVKASGAAPYSLLRHDFEDTSVGRWLLDVAGVEVPADTPLVERKLLQLSTLVGEKLEQAPEDAKELVAIDLMLHEPGAKAPRVLSVQFFRDTQAGKFLVGIDGGAERYRAAGAVYKDLLQPALHFYHRRPIAARGADIAALADGPWKSDAIVIDPAATRVLSELEVIAYDPESDVTHFSAEPQRWAFLSQQQPMRITLGAELSSQTEQASDAPRFILIEVQGQTPRQAVISAVHGKQLARLVRAR